MSILVVDDDSTYRFLVTRAFAKEELGEQLLLAANGGAAQHMLTQSIPRLVLLDLNLPDTSGLELLGWIRLRSRVPVLIHSWSVRRGDVEAAYKGGANGYVEKQTSFDRLRALIRNLHDYWVEQNQF